MTKRRREIQQIIFSYLIVFFGLPVFYSLDNRLSEISGFTEEWLQRTMCTFPIILLIGMISVSRKEKEQSVTV